MKNKIKKGKISAVKIEKSYEYALIYSMVSTRILTNRQYVYSDYGTLHCFENDTIVEIPKRDVFMIDKKLVVLNPFSVDRNLLNPF